MYGARIAAVHLRVLPVEQAFMGVPADPDAVRAVKELARGRSILTAVSDAAFAQGITPGMTLVEARARVPAIEARERDAAGERRLLEGAAELLLGFGPVVEVMSPAYLLVEIGHSKDALRGLGLEDETAIAEGMRQVLAGFGHEAVVAIADDADTARTLADIASDRARRVRPAHRRASHASQAKKAPPKSAGPAPAPVAKARAKPRARSHAAPPAVIIAPPDQSAQALAPLPVSALLWTDPAEDREGGLLSRMKETHGSLRILGVQDVGHLASFPAAQVASRFGDAGVILMERALGERRRPLRPFVPPERIVESFELDSSTAEWEPLLFIVKHLLDRLEARLTARGLAASAIEIAAKLDAPKKVERLRITLARPSRSARTWLVLARERLSGALSGEVRAISIEAVAPAKDLGAQLDLFTAHAQRMEQAEALIARLQAALGEGAVFSAELCDTHRPEAAWRSRPFEIEAALEEPSTAPVRPRALTTVPGALVRSAPREDYALPPATRGLSVVGLDAAPSGVEPATTEAAVDAPWPKTVKRKIEDEPLPDLAARPLELLAEPEAARIDGKLLYWRNAALPIADIGPRERFECEWWKTSPLEREYVVVELQGGRRLWLYSAPNAPLRVHGIFD